MTAPRPIRQMRLCAYGNCTTRFNAPHGQPHPAAYCSSECHRLAKQQAAKPPRPRVQMPRTPQAKKRKAIGPAQRARPIIDKQASEAWARGARNKPCAVCRAAAVQGHHIITQQQLRKVAKERGIPFERLRWDERNRLPLCQRHHEAHHSRAKPVGWVVLVKHAPKVFQFARELGLTWWLERYYPQGEERAA